LWGTGGDGGQKKRVIKTQIALSSDLDPVSGPTISPDGTMVAYVDRGRLWVRDLDKLESRGIEDTDGAVMPFWSPDNEYIGFQSQNTLWKIAPEGGKRIKIADLPPGLLYHAIWGSDDTIILNTGTSIPIELFSVSDQGGVPEPFRTPDTTRGERAISSSLFLPDGMSLLYSIFSSDGTIRTVLDSRGGETRTLTDSRTFRSSFSKIVLSPTGHMLSGNNVDGLWARPFSTKPLSYTGDPILVDQLGAYPSISRDGTIVYTRQASTGRQQLMWVNRDGRPGELIGQPQDMIDHPALSPDEKSVAVRGKENDNSDIGIHDTIRGTKRRITRAPVLDQQPAWLPDGDRISYTDGNGITFIARADASDTPQPLITDRPPRWSFHWSKDGSIVVYHIIAQRTGRDIWYQSMSDNEDPKSLIQTPSDEARPQLSPDGRHLAYQSDESGQWQVYICTFPDVTNKQQVSVNGGVWPQWNGNGDELFFVEENAMMAVKVNASGTPAIPERLFTGEEAGIALFSSTVNPTYPLGWRYDVTSDGQRFIVVKDLEPPKQSIVIVQNWFEEFRERE
jgi:serine/threonine-protein kinase